MNHDLDLEPDLRLLETALEEQVGNVQAPDLRHRILTASAEQRQAAATHAALAARVTEAAQAAQAARGSGRVWIAAGVFLLGIGVSWGIYELSRPDGDLDRRPIQDNRPQDSEKPQGGLFCPRSRDQFLKSLGHVEIIGIEILTTERYGHQFAPGASKPLEIRAGAEVTRITGLMASDLKPIPSAGWVWPNKIRLQMKNGRHMLASMNLLGSPTLGVAGIGDQAMGKELADALRPLIRQAEEHTRHQQGVVFTRSDLEGIPAAIERLTCYALRDEDLALLKRFTRVTLLDLRGCAHTISGSGLSHVARVRTLRHILLNNTCVDDGSVEKLAALPELSELNLTYATRITGIGFEAFQGTDTLRRLRLSNVQSLDDAGIRAIAGIRSLEYLNLSGRRTAERVTSKGLVELQRCRSLMSLDLAGSPWDMDQALAGFGNLPRLVFLDLSDTNVSADGFAAFHFIRSEDPIVIGAALKVLHLGRCRNIDDKALGTVAGLKNLEELDLGGCPGITDRGLEQLAGLAGLRKLDLSACRGLTQQGVNKLRQQLVNCAVTFAIR